MPVGSEPQRKVRAELAVRESLVRTRTKWIAVTGALLRREGVRVQSGNADHFVKRVGETAMADDLRTRVTPLLSMLVELQKELKATDGRIAAIVASDPVIQRLCTVPGVGPVTATAFVATVDDVNRFAGPHQLESYLGLVPSEKSSGERQHKGRITKAGNDRVRWLLVEAAWSVLISRRENTEELRRWAQRIALRGGMKAAIVALARRRAGILYAMWRDGTTFEPRRPVKGTAE